MHEMIKKHSIAVISECSDHRLIIKIVCLKKVIEKEECINVTKYLRLFLCENGWSAQFKERYMFRLKTKYEIKLCL